MFVQTEVTPNPNSLKFLPGKNVSNRGSFEITKKEDTDSELVRNLLSVNGVTGVFLGVDFLSINKYFTSRHEKYSPHPQLVPPAMFTAFCHHTKSQWS